MSKATTIALTLALAPIAGCSIFQISFGDKSNQPGARGAGAYTGPECDDIEVREHSKSRQKEEGSWETYDVTYAPQASPDAPLPSQAAHVVCADRISTYPTEGRIDLPAVLHDRFDAYDFDHAAAALIVANCSRSEECLLDVTPASATQHQRWAAGLLSFYAERLDREKAAAALEAAGVSAGLASALLQRVDAGVADIGAVVAAIPESERRAFVEIPAEARAESEAYFRAYNDQWRELAKLRDASARERAEGVGDETIAALEALRVAYVDKCGGTAACMHEGLPASVAHELFLAHVSRADAAAAAAEADLVEVTGPGRPAARVIFERQAEYLRAATSADSKIADAKRRGLDDDTATAAAAGGPAHDFSDAEPWRMDEAPRLDYRAVIPGQLQGAGGKLDAKKDNGDGTVTLAFADEVTRYPVMSCHDTNKIARVYADGRIDYEQRCRKTGKVRTDRRTFDPVVVPVAEAKPLHRGDEVALWALPGETKLGRVRWAKRQDQAVVVRNVPVKADDSAK